MDIYRNLAMLNTHKAEGHTAMPLLRVATFAVNEF